MGWRPPTMRNPGSATGKVLNGKYFLTTFYDLKTEMAEQSVIFNPYLQSYRVHK